MIMKKEKTQLDPDEQLLIPSQCKGDCHRTPNRFIVIERRASGACSKGRLICLLVLTLCVLIFGFHIYIMQLHRFLSMLEKLEKRQGSAYPGPHLVPVLLDRRGGSARSFTVDYNRNVFLKDGQPFRYVSGSIHYQRVPRMYWVDRLMKMRAAGLDAVQIYVPWNFHEVEEGQFNFSGDRDVEHFIQTARDLGLLVILRAGPYICGEWDFGGLPAWLLRKNATMVLRSSDKQFTAAVEAWFNVFLPKMRPLLYENGGPIIMVQVENEYGSYYTCDLAYLQFLYNLTRRHLGNNVVLFSTDGNWASVIKCGSADRRLFTTVDFGYDQALDPAKAFADLRAFQSNGPLVNSEYYVGWLDSWGSAHNRVPTQQAVQGLTTLLKYSSSVSVNMYMFHGGTTFGFWNGANAPPYQSQITSYDYDAPLTEAGDITDKYIALRSIIGQISNKTLPPYPGNVTKVAYGKVNLNAQTSHVLFNNIRPARSPVVSPLPLTMEALGQYQGFLTYQTSLANIQDGPISVTFDRIGDQAYVFTADPAYLSLQYRGNVSRASSSLKVDFVKDAASSLLVILVENQGHVNYGGSMFNDVKGIIGRVYVNGTTLYNWTMFGEGATKVPPPLFPGSKYPAQGSVHYGWFVIEDAAPADTFIKLTSFAKGVVYINTVNIGRYWPARGPQVTLYVPRSVLHQGSNLVVVLELEQANCPCSVEFVDSPILDEPIHQRWREAFKPTLFRRGSWMTVN